MFAPLIVTNAQFEGSFSKIPVVAALLTSVVVVASAMGRSLLPQVTPDRSTFAPLLVAPVVVPGPLVWPCRRIPWLVTVSFAVGLLLALAASFWSGTNDLETSIVVKLVLTMAEHALVAFGLSSLLALSSPRFAPLALSLLTAWSSFSTQLAKMSGLYKLPVIGGLALISASSLVILVLVRKFVFAPFYGETANDASTSPSGMKRC